MEQRDLCFEDVALQIAKLGADLRQAGAPEAVHGEILRIIATLGIVTGGVLRIALQLESGRLDPTLAADLLKHLIGPY